MIENILEIISTLIETLTMVFFGHLFLKKRKQPRIIGIAVVLLVFIIDYLLDYIVIPYYIAIVISCIEFFIILFIIYDISFINTLFFTWIYGVIMTIVDIFILCILTYVFKSEYGLVNTEKTAFFIGMFLSDAGVLALLYFVSILAKKKVRNIPKKYSIMIVMYPALCCFLIDL